MNKYLKKCLYVGLSALMVAGLGASMSNAHASINPNNYEIDVFPSRQTHNRFAYQMKGHNYKSRVYYSSRNSRLGRALFDKGVPNNAYSNYMARRHHKLFKSIVRNLEHYSSKRNNVKRNSRKNKEVTRKRGRKRQKRNRRVNRYNRKINAKKRKVTKKQNNQFGIKVLKSHFKRSNNKRLLKKSGYKDAQNDPKQLTGAEFIFNKYAPNDKRAVVPKNFNATKWYQGKVGQKNPVEYVYIPMFNGWIK